jgi:hypothetical protein
MWCTIFITEALVIKSWQYNHYTGHEGNATTMFRLVKSVFVIPTIDGHIIAYSHNSWVNHKYVNQQITLLIYTAEGKQEPHFKNSLMENELMKFLVYSRDGIGNDW